MAGYAVRTAARFVFPFLILLAIALAPSAHADAPAFSAGCMEALELLSLRPEYFDEERGEARALHYPVAYLSTTGRERYRLRIDAGGFTDAEGTPLGPAEGGRLNIVVDAEGNVYGWRPGRKVNGKLLHHSSFTRGGQVLFAGSAFFRAGRLEAISNDSGHYKPPFYAIRPLLLAMRAAGIETTGVRVRFEELKNDPQLQHVTFSAEDLDRTASARTIPEFRDRLLATTEDPTMRRWLILWRALDEARGAVPPPARTTSANLADARDNGNEYQRALAQRIDVTRAAAREPVPAR